MKTILLTAAGSASALPVLRRYQAAGLRVIACDIYPRSWNAAPLAADDFFQALTVHDEAAYVQQMLDAVRRYRVDALIPLTDPEVDVLCAHGEAFRQAGCLLCTPHENTVHMCRDKLLMARRLEAAGVCRTIPTYTAMSAPDAFPMMLKPRSGRSSQGQMVVHNREELEAAAAKREDYIAQPFLTGNIFTVDVARDADGRTQTLVRQELMRTGNGLGTTVEVYDNHPLEQICAAIADAAGLCGVVNMEFIHHEGDFYFLEVNPRFSGGTGFSQKAGMDVAMLMLQCHQGLPIGERGPIRPGIYTRQVEIIGG